MLKLTPAPLFEYPVRLTTSELLEPVEISLTFVYMTSEQQAQWFADNENKPAIEAIGGKYSEDGKTIEGGIVRGWSGVMGDNGEMQPFSLEALARLLRNYQPSAKEIVRAWQLGLSESRVKN